MAQFAPITGILGLQGNTSGASPLALPQFGAGAALNRLSSPIMGVAGATAQDPMFQMLEMQNQMLTMMIGLLMNLMQAQGQKMEGALSGSGGDISGGGGGSSAVGGGGGSSSGGGGGAANSNASSGPASPGAQGALDRARGMLGLNEHSNAAEINKVTKESGIDSSTTPWCAAFAINILKDAGILDTTGLKNPNYCPEIVRWAKEKNIWMERGSTPKPGDAILFDWGADGTSDHIGIVEKVENGKITTIEGNSSDSVKRNTYEIGSSKIMGFVKTKG